MRADQGARKGQRDRGAELDEALDLAELLAAAADRDEWASVTFVERDGFSPRRLRPLRTRTSRERVSTATRT